MLFTLAMGSCQNVQILLKLALMRIYDLLVQLQKLFSRWEIKSLLDRRPLMQVKILFKCPVNHYSDLFLKVLITATTKQ
jgi:hypothetical protein